MKEFFLGLANQLILVTSVSSLCSYMEHLRCGKFLKEVVSMFLQPQRGETVLVHRLSRESEGVHPNEECWCKSLYTPLRSAIIPCRSVAGSQYYYLSRVSFKESFRTW